MNEYLKMFCSTQDIYEHLQDEISKEIFLARCKYSLDNDVRKLRKTYFELFPDGWKVPLIDDTMEMVDDKDSICIWGAGSNGLETSELLSHTKYKEREIFFVDSDRSKWGNKTQTGQKIKNPKYLRGFNGIVLIESFLHRMDVYEQLRCIVNRKQILIPDMGHLVAERGIQYFDEFIPFDSEVFVDAGSCDGEDSLKFIEWMKRANRVYKHIYMLEPGQYESKKIENKFRDIPNAELIKKACWSSEERIPFVPDGLDMGAVCDESEYFVDGDSIDNMFIDDGITFIKIIKMDIEGSELNALIGARKTIQKYKPRLAICVYHKPEDIWSIPREICSICEDYKLMLRPYWSYQCETVLYGWI